MNVDSGQPTEKAVPARASQAPRDMAGCRRLSVAPMLDWTDIFLCG